MKAARIIWGSGLIFCALNLVAFFDLEKRARAMEANEAMLAETLDTATAGDLMQKGPPPIGVRILGVVRTNYGHDDIFDEMPVLAVWDGEKLVSTYRWMDEIIPRIVGYSPPDEWFPYPEK